MGHHVVVPSPPLDVLVSRPWDWDMPPAAHHFERVLPVPGAALIINLHENETRVYSDDADRRCLRAAASVIGGPCLRSQIIDTAEQVRVMGAVFHPGGAHAFTGEDHEALVGQDIGLEDIFGHSAHRLREQLLDTPCPHARLAILQQWLLAHMPATRVSSHAYVNPIVAVALGYFAAGEIITWRIIAGSLLVLVSVFLILRRD